MYAVVAGLRTSTLQKTGMRINWLKFSQGRGVLKESVTTPLSQFFQGSHCSLVLAEALLNQV